MSTLGEAAHQRGAEAGSDADDDCDSWRRDSSLRYSRLICLRGHQISPAAAEMADAPD
jgi:hypothetical protein